MPKALSTEKQASIIKALDEAGVTRVSAKQAVELMASVGIQITDAAMRSQLAILNIHGVLGKDRVGQKVFFNVPAKLEHDSLVYRYSLFIKKFAEDLPARKKAKADKFIESMNEKSKIEKILWGGRIIGTPGTTIRMDGV